MADNTLTSAEIKRRGLAAIEEGLRRGPVRIVKRNRLAAVVLSAEDYERLTAAGAKDLPGMGALEWLLSSPPAGRRSRREIDASLKRERDW
jgi:prevent-host-death family protein